MHIDADVLLCLWSVTGEGIAHVLCSNRLLSLSLSDTLYCEELNEKIRLLYRLHIPPGDSFCSRRQSPDSLKLQSDRVINFTVFVSAALTESEDDPSLMKSPLLSSNRPLYVNLPSGRPKHACVISC